MKDTQFSTEKKAQADLPIIGMSVKIECLLSVGDCFNLQAQCKRLSEEIDLCLGWHTL